MISPDGRRLSRDKEAGTLIPHVLLLWFHSVLSEAFRSCACSVQYTMGGGLNPGPRSLRELALGCPARAPSVPGNALFAPKVQRQVSPGQASAARAALGCQTNGNRHAEGVRRPGSCPSFINGVHPPFHTQRRPLQEQRARCRR